jgi:ribosomal protein S12 methylthiotransferase accessory factor
MNELRVDFPGGERVRATYRGFTIETDQPTDHGGAGTAPAPFDLFLASIATCAGYYLLAFLGQRGVPTDGVRLTLTTTWDEARGRVGTITLRLGLPAGFPEKYEKALVRAVDRCAVKQHVVEAPRFVTTVETAQAITA